jgi:fructose-1,6-bisphosphatase II
MSSETDHHIETFLRLSSLERMGNIFAQATEVAAMAASDTAGLGNKEASDRAAVDAMRKFLGSLDIDGVIEVGEGIKDKAPMLFIGEQVGTGKGEKLSIGVDPIDGTKATAGLMPGAISALAVTERGGILRLPPELHYVEKLITGPQAKDKVNINAPVAENIKAIADSLNKGISDIRITVLDRPRNQKLIDQIRETGARVVLIDYGDLVPGVLTCVQGSETHAVMGSGGAPEAVLTAAGVICFGGGIQVKPWSDDPKVIDSLEAKGFSLDKVFTERDLITGRSIIFSTTGVTHSGNVIDGVRSFRGGVRRDTLLAVALDGVSMVIRKDSTLVTDTKLLQYRLT